MRAGAARGPGRGRWVCLRGLALTLLLQSTAGEAGPPAAGTGQRPRGGPRAVGLGHTVRPDETLWTIGRQHGVSVESLRRANRLEARTRLRAGQTLVVPTSAGTEMRQEPPSLARIVLEPPPEASRVALVWPIPSAVVSGFGPRGPSWHGGIDVRAEQGTPIHAAAPGMVITSAHERGYGNVIKIWHHGDLMTVYAHNHENAVRVGEWVERGQVIGTVGRTGRTTAPHLHFEVRLDGKKYDPLYWLPAPEHVVAAVAAEAPRPR